jgi:hypothetical protein
MAEEWEMDPNHCNSCHQPNASCTKLVRIIHSEGNVLIDKKELACHSCRRVLNKLSLSEEDQALTEYAMTCDCWMAPLVEMEEA